MASFCVKCGAPLGGGPFCVKCGTDVRTAIPSPSVQVASPVSTTQAAPVGAEPQPRKSGMSTLAKLGIAALAIVVIGATAGTLGLYYVAHKVTTKYHQVADGILGSSSGTGAQANSRGDSTARDGASGESSMGDVCRFLSKDDVSRAVGVPITRAEPGDNGCSYMARGTQAEMSAKHMKAMVADQGGNKETQDIAENFAGGIGAMFAKEEPASQQDASGEVPVFSFSLDQNVAEQQLRLNAKVLGNLGPQQGLPGIGDQAFVSADGMMFVRKGKTLVRILYLSCPCGTEQVKPLAKKLADSL